ncbi:MAG TPA: hypothetical protein VK472_01470 [Allosphingosinicella sp.]|nr:hypothetical protein [Allosphingosinicella sp.]
METRPSLFDKDGFVAGFAGNSMDVRREGPIFAMGTTSLRL